MFHGKKILIGVTGGIAAYKAADLVSALRKAGADVLVLMTDNARKFVSPLTFRSLSHNPVITGMFDRGNKRFPHLSLADQASAFIIVPATANFIAKAAHGIADDIVSTTFISVTCPVIIAPAMNTAMYENKIVQKNIRALKRVGITFVQPKKGVLACGQTGVGKLAEVKDIISGIQKVLKITPPRAPLEGKKIVITGGGTREHIDPVRYITNASSGKMGQALANAARNLGANVIYIDASTSVERLRKNVLTAARDADAVIMAAAVSDYRPRKVTRQKIKSGTEKMLLELEKTPDILKEIGRKKRQRLLVGFCLETDDLIRNARNKLRSKNLDLIIANGPEAIGSADNKAVLLRRNGTMLRLKKMSKEKLAEHILAEVRRSLGK
jgi:phosphopantothenoylcysteine decarboxylase/phosphopantothenate--cysteine ligase